MQRRRRNSGLKWVFLVAIVAVAAFAMRSRWKANKKSQYPPNAFYEVKRGDMLISVLEDGALRALNETVVRSQLEGYNRIIHLVPEGAHVEKGELLVELDSSGLRDRLADQELLYQDRLFMLLQAKENLKIQRSLAESQILENEVQIENAQSDLEKYRDGDAPLQIQTVEARSKVLTEQVRIASERYARTQELFKNGQATRSELEADQLSLKKEQLALGQYQEDLRLIKKFDQPNQIRQLTAKVAAARADLERLKHRTSNEIAQAEADLKTSQRSLELLDDNLKTLRRKIENTKIFAPQEGLVVYAQVSPFQNFSSYDSGRGMRGGRGGGPGGDGGGEFRGGGRRGNRNRDTESSSGAASGVAAVAAANQRIASAISGAADAGSGGGNADAGSGGGRGGGGSGGGGGGTVSSASAFVTYQSMRPSSTMPQRSSTIASSAGSSLSVSSSGASGFGAPAPPTFNFRQRSGDNFDYDINVTPGLLQEGIMVRMRQELIRLPDVSKMLAEVKVNEQRVRQVRAGMTAWIRVENIPDRKFKGTVRRVALLPDAQASWMNPDVKVFPTDILVEDELPDLKPGVSARAEIIITNLTKVLSVPIHTVARWRGENVCFVKRGTGVAPVSVTTGWFNDRFVEVTSGLREGDLVLLAAEGDEDMEDSTGSTNEVENSSIETNQPAEMRPNGEEPRRERRNGDVRRRQRGEEEQ